ncbi:hypothetical protein BOTNAR_0673g00030 [Botryotinia narcissicola]|uniref:Uncharacterized protein n=1 Tax=Botryotinia narcissicola TaxID=278944 RepID=A0A4Z1H9D1_9HELO|nr:hypothetical protein BOTNAR_0673g00030 [Botryotinia narcissicola]
MKHPVPPQSSLQLPSPYPRVAQHSVPVLTILPTQLIAIRPVQFTPPPLPPASLLKPSLLQPPISSPAPVPTIPPTLQTASSPVPSTPRQLSSPSRKISLQLILQIRVAKVSRSQKEIRVRRLWEVRVRVLIFTFLGFGNWDFANRE